MSLLSLFQDLEMLADLALTLTILRCFTLLGKYVSCGGGEGKEGGRRGEDRDGKYASVVMSGFSTHTS